MKKNNNLFWGLIFIAAAFLVLAGQLEIFDDISLTRISLGILFIIISIRGLFQRNFFVFLLFLASFFIMFDEEFKITAITPMPILFAALLGSIGLTMLFPDKNSRIQHHGKQVNFDNITNEADESEVKCRTQFGATVKYVNTTCLTRADIYCSFGGADIYFDAAKLKGKTATINLDVSFGGVEIYIPRNWEIEQSVNAMLGGIDIKGMPDSIIDSTVTITGNVKFGGVTIHYV